MTALGKSWHPEHFVCFVCEKPITAVTFNEREGNPVCSDCYAKKYSEKCHQCSKAIVGVSIFFLLKIYLLVKLSMSSSSRVFLLLISINSFATMCPIFYSWVFVSADTKFMLKNVHFVWNFVESFTRTNRHYKLVGAYRRHNTTKLEAKCIYLAILISLAANNWRRWKRNWLNHECDSIVVLTSPKKYAIVVFIPILLINR